MNRFVVIFFVCFLSARSATWTAATAQRADVVNVLGLASSGDTVIVPAGSATWASAITTTKSIQFIGSDGTLPPLAVNNTSIITTAAGVTAFDLTPAADTSLTRIAGFKFLPGSFSTHCVNVHGATPNGSGTAVTQLRIDHNYFYRGGRAVYAQGNTYGVVDHNWFQGCSIAVGPEGDNYATWNRAITAGTANALFIETNTFNVTAADSTANGGELQEQIYHFEGARSVIRYNAFDASTNVGFDVGWIDSHGNQAYFTTGTDGTVDHGQPIIEIYNNTMTSAQAYRLIYLRSGSVLAHDNTVINSSGSAVAFDVTEEEGWQPLYFSPLRTVWPACEQMFNSFFWNNTFNGSAVTTLNLSQASDSTFIQAGRDYFMAAPASSGGIETFSGFAGGSSAAPTGASASTMSFAAGANAYYPYTAYVYPHPLVSGGSTGGSAISGKISILGKVIIR